ncbi:MAG: hypothetical protein JKY56_04270 [Kofleriaceae bacterium]|nr:hypothetical protein [Kofleriaceae bacterium]
MQIIDVLGTRLALVTDDLVSYHKTAADYSLEMAPTSSSNEIASLGNKIHGSIPESLVSLFREQGGFSNTGFDTCLEQAIQVFSAKKLLERAIGLVAFIDEFWGGRPEFTESYKEGEIAQLNHSYTVFGVRVVNDDSHDFFYFDTTGNFGSVFLNQNDFETAAKESFSPMLEKSPANMNLEELLSQQIGKICSGLDEMERYYAE